jgi:hypothetical protein
MGNLRLTNGRHADDDREPRHDYLGIPLADIDFFITGHVLVVAPSLFHVEVLQDLLKDKLPNAPIVTFNRAAVENADDDDILWVPYDEHIPVREFWQDLPESFGFLPDHVFVIYSDHTNHVRCEALRDQSGWSYGDREKGISSLQVIETYNDLYHYLKGQV